MRKQGYSLVVFDWEGTLGDTVGQTLIRLANEVEQPMSSADVGAHDYLIRYLSQSVRACFPHWSDEQIEHFCDMKLSAHKVSSADASLFPDAKRLLMSLKRAGLDLAIATNKGQQSLQCALQRAGIQDLITVTRSAGQTQPKPCPQMLEEILIELAYTADDALMVGDSVSDMEMARQIGMVCVGIDFYHQNTAALLTAGAEEVFDNYQDLANYLNLPIDN